MVDRRVLIDTSILIEYFRKKNKKATRLYKLVESNYSIVTSSICYFEYLAGSKEDIFDKLLFEYIGIIAFDAHQAKTAAALFRALKSKNELIEFRDILIASSAISNNLPISTMNTKHFNRIEDLMILEI